MQIEELTCLRFKGGPDEGVLQLLDQRELPLREQWLDCRSVQATAAAISDMVVRGAPAIGITAAYGMVLAAQEARRTARSRPFLMSSLELLAATRPTAVNLFWALDRVKGLINEGKEDPASLLKLAESIHREDVEGNRRMGELGAAHLKDGMGVLTHCNAGALATGGFGTALAPIFVAHQRGIRLHVFVDETRPRLQGARLTAYELSKVGVPFTLICDNMAASLMAKGKINFCITGADRIAANGDTANKIGTYSVAVNAAHHQIPFHVAAPKSTFDLATPNGDSIKVEERSASEITQWGLEQTSPVGANVYNPAFDVTPAKLIRSIFTDRGEIAPVGAQTIAKAMK